MTVPRLATVLAVALLCLSPIASSQGPFPDAPPAPEGLKAHPGMAYVEGGEFEMGAPERALQRWYKDKAWILSYLEIEWPEHEVEIQPFWMDRFEVTNQQFLTYLEGAWLDTFTVQAGPLRTLSAIATEIYGPSDADWWRALYHQNEKTVNPDKKELLDGGVPQPSWAGAELPENTVLKIYRRPIPSAWLTWLKNGITHPGRDEIAWPYPDDLHDHPVAGVSLVHAREYAAWAGKHIPFEDEWERAARGPKDLVRPWGGTWRADEWKRDEDRLNWAQLRVNHPARNKNPAILTTPVGSFHEGMSPYGMFDMLGNVMEWTDSMLVAYPGSKVQPRDWWPAARIVRGGSYQDALPEILRTTFRFGGDGVDVVMRPESSFLATGFRCAKWLVPGADRAYMAYILLDAEGKLPDGIAYDLRGGIGVERRLEVTPTHSVYVPKEARSLGILPREEMPRGMGVAKELEKEAAADEHGVGVVVGLLHTGVPLRVSAPGEAGEAPATAEPGDYVLAFHDGRLQLCRWKVGGAERTGYLTTKAQQADLDKEAEEKRGAPLVDVTNSFEGATSTIMDGYDRVDIVFSVRKAVGRSVFAFRAPIHTAERDAVKSTEWDQKQK